MIDKSQKSKNTFVQELRNLIIVLTVFLTFVSFIFQPFIIPSGSMKPGLIIGDVLVVSKYTYGYSKHSFPLHPDIFSGRISEGRKPTRGEVVVFYGPNNPKINTFDRILNFFKRFYVGLESAITGETIMEEEDVIFIKRIVGLPGDRVQMINGVLHINGQPAEYKYTGEFESYNRYDQTNVTKVFDETLPDSNGKTYPTLKDYPRGLAPLDNTREFIVPEGHYFMKGDNTDGSSDSRAEQHFTFIPYECLIGPARTIIFSTSAKWWEVHKWLFGIRFSRLFKTIN